MAAALCNKGVRPLGSKNARVQRLESGIFAEKYFSGTPDDQTKQSWMILKIMVLLEVRKWIDWDQTKNDQGPWPRKSG